MSTVTAAFHEPPEPARAHADPAQARGRLRALVETIGAHDETARAHIAVAKDWIASGAPLWRTAKPATPPMHLVSYFVPRDPSTGRLLLVHHRNAGLLLPPGGHVEPGEDPWHTVIREAWEELRYEVDPASEVTPVFLTVTETRGPGTHTDVSLWYVLNVSESQIAWHDPAEFDGVKWLTREQILQRPADSLDPHLHRFVHRIA